MSITSMKKNKALLSVPALLLCALLAGTSSADGLNKFKHKKKSTIDTFPFQAIDSDELANAVIEGGLEAPAAGEDDTANLSPGGQNTLDLDSLARQTDQGRIDSSIEATVNFKAPRVVPGQTQTGQYVIAPPSNRTYQYQNITTTPR